MAFTSALCDSLPAANDSLQRFDARYFTLNFPTTMVATMTADDPTSLTVVAETRSNRDLIGLIWSSQDTVGHPMLQYINDINYSGIKLGFVANPRDLYNFTVTFTANGLGLVYRLYPYKVSGTQLVPNVVSKENNGPGPGLSFNIADVFPNGVPDVPTGSSLYVIDFDNLKQGYNYDGDPITVTNVAQLFFSIIQPKYGLGSSCKLANAGRLRGVSAGQAQLLGTENLTHWHLTGCDPNLVFKTGDLLTISMSVPTDPQSDGKSGYLYSLEAQSYEIQVTEWYGFGTTDRYIKMSNDGGAFAWIGGPCSMNSLQLDSATGRESLTFTMSGISVTGARSQIGKRTYPTAEHHLMMTSGFDDTYNITPWRQLNQIYQLGYRNFFNVYMGMSHYFKADSTMVNQVYKAEVVKDFVEPINAPTVAWLQNLFAHMHDFGFQFIWSTSFEIMNAYIPTEWAQKDYTGKAGLSGWSPPSSFVVPTHPECIEYLSGVIKQGMGLLAAANLEQRFQIGEPWWWDGSYTNGAPCIYDEYTQQLYTAETGSPVPTPFIQNYKEEPDENQQPFLNWLGDKLGICTNTIRDNVKAAYPNALGTLLFFTPQIFQGSGSNIPGLPGGDVGKSILATVNFPIDYWKYPNYDFVQIEDYDWIIAGYLDRVNLTIQAATETLGYPLDVVHYFVGFVNDKSQTWVWPNMNLVLRSAKEQNIPFLYVWAYTQVIRDGILYDDAPIGTQPAIQPALTPRRQLPDNIGDGIIRPIFFCKIGDDILMNSSDRNIDFGGATYFATGQFGKIDSLTEGMDSGDSGWTMALGGVPLFSVDDIGDSLEDKPCTLMITLAGPDNIPLFDPRVIGVGNVYSTAIQITSNVASIAVTIRSSLSDWAKASTSRYTDEFQQLLHPGDRGFKFLATLQNQKINWGS